MHHFKSNIYIISIHTGLLGKMYNTITKFLITNIIYALGLLRSEILSEQNTAVQDLGPFLSSSKMVHPVWSAL